MKDSIKKPNKLINEKNLSTEFLDLSKDSERIEEIEIWDIVLLDGLSNIEDDYS